MKPPSRLGDQLTPREFEVLQAIFGPSCLNNHETADLLGISSRTVEIHRQQIMEKTGAKNAVALTRMYLGAPIEGDRRNDAIRTNSPEPNLTESPP